MELEVKNCPKAKPDYLAKTQEKSQAKEEIISKYDF